MSFRFIFGTTFLEDFNYGYPYKNPLPLYAPEFTYSTSEITHSGVIHPTSYAKNFFQLQYQSRKTNPDNTDFGVHSGAMAPNGYYLTFPVLTWGQVQTLTLKLRLSLDSTLSFYRSWDGHINDVHSVVVNGKVHDYFTNTAGHGWTRSSIPLSKGVNTITWALETSLFGTVLRNGETDPSVLSNLPVLPRILRLANITVGSVSSIIYPILSYGRLISGGTMSGVGHLAERSPVSLKGAGSLTYKVKRPNAAVLTGFANFITDAATDIEAKCLMAGGSTMAAAGRLNHVHSSLDAGMVLDTTAELSVFIPIDTTQSVAALVKPINVSVITMNAPIIVKGVPVMPAYTDFQLVSWTTAGGYTYNNAVLPSDVAHLLPNTPTYRWVSVDVTGADDATVSTWPERFGGPSFQSSDIFMPTVHPHVHFNEKDFSYTSYARVVTFYWRYVQHMWANLTTANVPYTFMLTGIFNPSTKEQWQHVLSSGYSVTTPSNWTDQVQDSVSVNVPSGGEGSYTGNLFFGVHDDGVVINNPNGNHQHIKGQVDWRPAIYTIVCTATDTFVYARHRGHKWSHHSTINNVNANKFLLGRETMHLSENFASHMSLMEVDYWNRALSSAEVLANENYLMGVYQLEKYV